MKKKFLCALLVAVLGVTTLMTGCGNNAKGGTPMNDTFFNPIRIERNMGDPWLYYHDGNYYYMHSGGTQIKVTKSPYMTQVVENAEDESVTKVIFRQKSINVVEIWAPEIFFFEGRWYVYFTATTDSSDTLEKDTGRRIYGMRSKTDDAMGEWETAVKIDLPADCRAIDATFMNYDGKQYIIWSGWPSKTNSNYKQNLYITELETGNPLKAKSLDDDKRVLISQPTYGWETKGAVQNEGPAVCFSPEGKPFVLFSGSYSGGDGYCIGYLELTGDPMNTDAWVKNKEPLMQTDMDYAEVIAPGHCSVTQSPDGKETWICYHAAKFSGAGWNRMARLQKMEWVDGKPSVDKISKFDEAIPLPSGEKVNRVRYEAEDATLTDCAVIKSEGYASGDKAVSIMEGGNITFEVTVPKNGQYLLFVRFSNREATETSMNVEINGDKYELFAPRTEYDDLFVQTYTYCPLYIKKSGSNVIKITCDKSIYIDCIVVDYLKNA